MKVYWRNREKTGSCEFAEAVKRAKTNRSKVSDGNIVIGIGKKEIFFYPTEYKIDGFSMTHKEFATLVLEVLFSQINPSPKNPANIAKKDEKNDAINDLIDKLMSLDAKSRKEVMAAVMFFEEVKEVMTSKKTPGNKKN